MGVIEIKPNAELVNGRRRCEPYCIKIIAIFGLNWHFAQIKSMILKTYKKYKPSNKIESMKDKKEWIWCIFFYKTNRTFDNKIEFPLWIYSQRLTKRNGINDANVRVHLNFLPVKCVLKIAFATNSGTCDENHSHMCNAMPCQAKQ